MPTYHLSVKTFSRGRGETGMAASAYRAGEKLTLHSEKNKTLEHTALGAIAYRTGAVLEHTANQKNGSSASVTYDYSRRHRGIAHTEIFHPADAPSWMSDRAKLWSEADRFERRKNSVVAREVEVSLPHELGEEQRKALARGLAAHLVERYGVAVDMAIHLPSKHSDQRNHHAHLLMTTRRVGKDGFTEKTRELDDRLQGKEVKHLRETWAAMVNEALEGAGNPERVDHRTLQAQGVLDRKPQVHLGKALNLERKGIYTRQGDKHRYVEHKNTVSGYQKGVGRGAKEKIEESINQAQRARSGKPKRKEQLKEQGQWEGKLEHEREHNQKLAR